MRVSTAVTLALTALLATSLFGVAVGTPTTSAPEKPAADSIDDRALQEHPSLTTSQTQSSSAATSSLAASQSAPDAADPKQVIRISVSEDGDATWTIESRFFVTDDDETEFLEYADAVTSGQRGVSYDPHQFDSFRRDAEQSTGREMSFEGAGWDDPRIVSLEEADVNEQSVPETDEETDVRVGIISYSFTWTNFATVDDDRVYFGDAMTGFPALADGQRLVVESPSGYALETPTQLTWDGPYEFSDDEFEIVFVRSGASGLGAWWFAGVVGLVFAVGIGSYLFARRQPSIDLPEPLERLPGRIAALGIRLGIPGHVFGRARQRASSDHNQTRDATGTDGGVATEYTDDGRADSAAGTQLEFEEEVDDDIDPELLSDEERVLRMLRQNGGRMKQASIVTETGWSNAKVSQLLSQMDEDDEIEKLRIGRENLITLPEVDPTKLS